MRALRSMKGLRTVEGRVTTQVMGRARAESANFVLDWVGLDGLQEAFWERQAERVGSVYDEYGCLCGGFGGKVGADWYVGIRSRRGFGEVGWGCGFFWIGCGCGFLDWVGAWGLEYP